MSKRLSLTVSDAIHDAILAQAKRDGQGAARGAGKDYVIRKALKYWLTKNGHRAAELDETDAEYQKRDRTSLTNVPDTRNVSSPALPDVDHTHKEATSHE